MVTGTQTESSPTALVEHLQQAINQHDLDALAACFDPDYQSEFPVHPDRAFRGHDQMRKNWSRIFSAVPDIEAVLLRYTCGLTIQGVQQDRIAWARLYMEPAQESGTDAAVR
ncbi:hypothetical protein BH24ACT19_BH24ACT19_18590 [soil metagenome]|jgi:hypothetical protein